MANILPLSTSLEEVMEGDYVNQYFTDQLDINESLLSITIINYQPVTNIVIAQNHYTGNYTSIFTTDANSLKYRKDDEFINASSWDKLPTKGTADLYYWSAPKTLQKTFSYTVKMIYNKTEQVPPGTSGETSTVTTQHELIKTYTQTVKGNWSNWANQLRDYVRT